MKQNEQKAKQNGDNNQVQGFVFGINLKGSEQVVMEGIKAFTSAMTNSGGVLVTPVVRPVLPSAPTGKPKSSAATVIEHPDETVEIPDAQIEVGGEEEEVETPSNGTGQKRNYSFKKPKFLNDLDITQASKPLADFIKEKNPTDVMDKYIVVAVWLLSHMKVSEVTVDHVYTVFDILGWKGEMPTNPSVPLRDLKTKNMLTRERGAEGYKINFKGEKYVENMGK